ncbi:MAG: DUF2007 domain-containing protein [Actinobacteria bacterium]|nr:DUF2007 domain-containing protein [Actinomycetota bacterium]
MFCIKCGVKITELTGTCPTCSADLTGLPGDAFIEYSLADLYDSADLDWETATLMVVNNTAEASAVRGLLESSGIPVGVRASSQSMPKMGVVVGGIEILVPEPALDYARELLQETDLTMDSQSAGGRVSEGSFHETELISTAKSIGLITVLATLVALGLKAIKDRLLTSA